MRVLFTFSLTLLFLTVSAQPNVSPSGFGAGILCGSEAGTQDAMKGLEDQWETHVQKNTGNKTMPYTLPVVFHVIHENGSENISQARILAGLENVNRAFANSDFYDQGTGVATNISFCLAQRNPDNGATNGVTRTTSDLTNLNRSPEDDLALKALVQWNPLRYINVYVVQEICSASDENDCSVAGYAVSPSEHGGPNDGIVLEARWINASPQNAVVLVHELGHYLGLYHTFEGGCSNNDCLINGDRVCDTPPDASRSAIDCDNFINSCSTDTDDGFTTDVPDQMNNYMDYNYFRCQNMFSAGQLERMLFFLEGTRASLLSSSGCSGLCPTPVIAGFSGGEDSMNGGEAATFSSTSVNGTDFVWLINGVPAGTSPTLTFTPPTAGSYVISLRASRPGSGCLPDSISRTVEFICPFSADINLPPVSLRSGETYEISTTTEGQTTAAWSINGEEAGTEQTLIFSPEQTGFYEICLNVSSSTCNDNNCTRVAVGEPLCDDDDCPDLSGCNNVFQLRFEDPTGIEARDLFAAVLKDGNRLYAAGANGVAPLIMTFNAQGTIRWQSALELPPNTNGRIISLRLLPNGDVLGLGRYFQNDRAQGILLRISGETGSLRWAKSLRSNGEDLYLNDLLISDNGTQATVVGSVGNSLQDFDYDVYRSVFNLTDGSAVLHNRSSLNSVTVQYSMATVPGAGTAVAGFSVLDNSAIPHCSFYDENGAPTERILFPSGQSVSCYGVTSVPDGLVFIGNTDNDQNSNELIVWKTSFSGELIWSKRLSTFLPMFLFDVISNDVGILLVGNSNSSQYLIQLDDDGNFGFGRSYTETTRSAITPKPLLVTETGLYLAGAGFGRGQSVTKMTTDGRIPGIECISEGPVSVAAFDFPMSQMVNSLNEQSTNISSNDLTGYTTNLLLADDSCTEECLELCGNGIDDDNDGFVDCLDEDLADNCCCRTPPVIDLGNDSTVCLGYVLRARMDEVTYLWSDGSTADSLIVSTSGDYVLSVTDVCGNIASDTVTLNLRPRPEWNLGNDTTICQGGSVTLAGPADYVSYEWNTGELEQTITTESFGVFRLRVTDSCGLQTTEEVRVSIDEGSVLDLGPDRIICPNETVTFTLQGFDEYFWTNTPGLECPDCNEVNITTDTSLLLGVTAVFGPGCFSFDTVRLVVSPTTGTNTSQALCTGDTIRFGDQVITEPGTYYQETGLPECPIIDTLLVETFTRPFGSDSLKICSGESILIFDRLESAAGTYERSYPSPGGCDSLHRIILTVVPEAESIERLTICPGDSVFINGDFRRLTGVYIEVFQNAEDCDSTVMTELVVADSIVTRETIRTVKGSPVLVFGNLVEEPGIYRRNFASSSGCDSLHEVTLELIYQDIVYVPSAFSPNADGINDIFRVYPSPSVERLERLEVFDRFGNQVFNASNVNADAQEAGWDGSGPGGDFSRRPSAGVFVYLVVVRLRDGSSFTRRGDVLLFR